MINVAGFVGIISSIALYSGDHITSTAAWVIGGISFMVMCSLETN